MGKLLVIEDDENLRESMVALLSAFGHEVIQAKDGLEGLMIYRIMSDDIALTIMDMEMPKMDGSAATRVIKEVKPSAKIILMTERSEQSPSDLKPDGFLYKPFKSQHLRKTVEEVLKLGENANGVASAENG